MNKKEFLKVITFLGMTYNKEFEEEQVAVWYEFFKNENIEVLKQAIKNLGSTNQFMPSIAEIKKEMAKIQEPTLRINAENEWEEVLKAIRKFGYYREQEALESLNPITQRIVKIIGWRKLCSSENIHWQRKEFIEWLQNNQDHLQEIMMLGEQNITMAELETKRQKYLCE